MAFVVVLPALYGAGLAVSLMVAAVAVVAVRSLCRPSGPPWAVSYLVTLACLYLPYTWLAVMDAPWDSYRWFWIVMWPILPGFAPGITFHANDATKMYVMAVSTVILIALFTWLGSLGRRARIASVTVALIGSGLQSWFALACFLL